MDSLYRPLDGGAGGATALGNRPGHTSKRFWNRQRLAVAGAAGLLLIILLSFSGGQYAGKNDVFRPPPSHLSTSSSSSMMRTDDCASERRLRVLHYIDRPTMESTMDR